MSANNQLEKFRLGKDGKHGNLQRALSNTYWRCREIYISNVCIALHLTPQKTEGEALKAELYQLLRAVWQTALLCNLTRPVVAVISSHDGQPLDDCEYRKFVRWSMEQNWHQGHFCLYVESPRLQQGDGKNGGEFDAERILLDLLAPEPQDIPETEWRTFETIESDIRQQLEKDTKHPVSELTTSVFEAWRTIDCNDHGNPLNLGPFTSWWEALDDKLENDCKGSDGERP